MSSLPTVAQMLNRILKSRGIESASAAIGLSESSIKALQLPTSRRPKFQNYLNILTLYQEVKHGSNIRPERRRENQKEARR